MPIALDEIDREPFAAKAFERLVAKRVAPHPGHQRHVAAESRGGHRLIGALAAGRGAKSSAQHGFPRRRQACSLNHQIGVHTADDDDLGSRHRSLLL